jgi:hypothetical protein
MCELSLKKKVRCNDDVAAIFPTPHSARAKPALISDTPPLAESGRWQKFPPHTPSFLPARHARFAGEPMIFKELQFSSI